MLILIPAAGASSRMRGRDKLLEQIDGQPLLARQVLMALSTDAEVLVTLPKDRPARAAALADLGEERLSVAVIPDADEGMAASLRAGAAEAMRRGSDALMIVLADMPELEAADLRVMMAAATGDHVVRACDETGQVGHPVIFPARLFPALGALRGDQGARPVLAKEAVHSVPLPGTRATTDLDTPEDWDAWRARTGR